MATKDLDKIGEDTDSPTLQRYIISATKDVQLTLLMTSIQVCVRCDGGRLERRRELGPSPLARDSTLSPLPSYIHTLINIIRWAARPLPVPCVKQGLQGSTACMGRKTYPATK